VVQRNVDIRATTMPKSHRWCGHVRCALQTVAARSRNGFYFVKLCRYCLMHIPTSIDNHRRRLRQTCSSARETLGCWTAGRLLWHHGDQGRWDWVWWLWPKESVADWQRVAIVCILSPMRSVIHHNGDDRSVERFAELPIMWRFRCR
jgi:hypothetical protein